MLFIVIGIVAAAFGLLDYFEIVDTPTSLVLTGVGAVTLLAGVGQLQKDRRAKADAPREAPAVPPTNGHAGNGSVAANGSYAQGETNGAAEKASLWQRLNKPVGGKDAGGKHRSRRSRKADEVPEPAVAATPVTAPAPGQSTPAPVAQAEAPPEEKTSFWKKLNQPVGKGPGRKGNAAPGEEGKKKRRRRGKDDEDEGPLFPETLAEGPDPFEAPPPGAIPPAPVPVAPASSPAPQVPDQPLAAPDAPGGPDDVAWDLPAQQAPLQGTAAGPVPPAVPDAPHEVAEQTAPVATAVAEPQAEAPRRGRRVCNYCWEPNDPTAAVCSACGAGL